MTHRDDSTGTVTVPLTRGMLALIDESDGPDVLSHTWCAWQAKPGYSWYAMRRKSKAESPRREVEYLHRRIMHPPPGISIDHVNGNGLDCRRSNMRFATHAQNQRNQRRSVANTSGFRGVSWDAENLKWRASITVEGKSINLGRFDMAEDAAAAYDRAAISAFGEFASTNATDR